MQLYIVAAELLLRVLMFFMDPKRAKRKELEAKKAKEFSDREEYAKALKQGDTLTVAFHLNSLLREARSNYSRGRQDSKASQSKPDGAS